MVSKSALPVLYPWDILHLLDQQNRLEAFIAGSSNARERVELFWKQCQRQRLPFIEDLDLSQPKLTIPLCFHCDGVKIYRNQKMFVFSFASSTCKGPTLSTKMVFAVLREAEAVKGETLDDLAHFIGYCLEFLAKGIYPDRDERGRRFRPGTADASRAGTPFTKDGWRACFAAFKADWEGKIQVHKFLRNYNSRNICEHCFASVDGPFAYSNFSPQAPYRDTYLSHDQYVMLEPANRLSAWQCVPGWRKERNCEDLLHLVHQGVAQPLA